jgi:hypothetical protein
MEQDGFVSLWVGTATNAAELEAILDTNGEVNRSDFASALRIEWSEEEVTREGLFLPRSSQDLGAILVGFSYEEVIIPRFRSVAGKTLPHAIRAALLLYDFRFSGIPSSVTVRGSRWTFVGCVDYRA